jgi:hypothetical protein
VEIVAMWLEQFLVELDARVEALPPGRRSP